MEGRPSSGASTAAWLTLIAVSLSAGFLLLPVGRSWDMFFYDFLFLARGAAERPEKIVIVAIDEPSFGVLQKQWPWPRSLHARLIESLASAGARAAAFDLIFAEPSDPGEDRRLAEALKSFPGAVLASDINVTDDEAYAQTIVVGPAPELYGPETMTGFINLPVDADGFVRRAFAARGEYASFDLIAARAAGGGAVTLPPGENTALINFSGPPRSVKTVSYYQALEPDKYLPKGLLDGALVFVGMSSQTAAGAAERAPEHYPTPFTRWGGGYMAGVEIHANAAWNFLTGNHIRSFNPQGVLLVSVITSLGAGLLFNRLKLVYSGALLFGAVSLAAGLSFILFVRYNTYLQAVHVAIPLTASYTASLGHHYWRTWREKNYIRKVFSTYVAQPVVNEILKRPEQLKLGGETVNATVLFTDLAGFTTFSGRMSPADLIEVINRYLGATTDIILRREGMIDKFIGDAVMAVWGVPARQPDHAVKACAAALEMKRVLGSLAAEEERLTGIVLKARVGINSGEMVAGNVGGERFFNYTVLGSEVNMASRLEGINKAYGTDIIIGANTAAAVRGAFVLRELDTIQVKGGETPVTIHELCGEAGSVDDKVIEINRLFGEGLALYRQGRWSEAGAVFGKCLEINGGDGPSRAFAERVAAYEKEPPEPWDGVHRFTVK